MATRKFTSYDLIADIVPGGMVFVIFYPIIFLIPDKVIPSLNLFTGATLLLLIYFIGRFVHELSSLLYPKKV